MGEGNLLVVIVTFQRVNHHLDKVAIEVLMVVRLVVVPLNVLVVEPKIVWGLVETNIVLLRMATNAIADE